MEATNRGRTTRASQMQAVACDRHESLLKPQLGASPQTRGTLDKSSTLFSSQYYYCYMRRIHRDQKIMQQLLLIYSFLRDVLLQQNLDARLKQNTLYN